MRTPVAILTGFLGSGKTSFLNRTLAESKFHRTAVLVNEFGEIGLDHHLIAGASDNVVLLENGCLCCAVKGDLVKALDALHNGSLKGELPPFDRVVIETSGIAEPTPLIELLLSEPTIRARFEPHSVTTMVDAINGMSTLQEHVESVKQVAVADRILITKTDLLADQGSSGLVALRGRIRALNQLAPVWDARQLCASDWLAEPTSDADMVRYLERFATSRVANEEVPAGALAGDGCYRPLHHPHPPAGTIRSFVVVEDEPIPMAMLERFLDGLARSLGPAILRVKGLVHVAEHAQGPAVVHGAQLLLHGLSWLPNWPDEDRRTRLVFITLDSAAAEVEELLSLVRRMSRPATFPGRTEHSFIAG